MIIHNNYCSVSVSAINIQYYLQIFQWCSYHLASRMCYLHWYACILRSSTSSKMIMFGTVVILVDTSSIEYLNYRTFLLLMIYVHFLPTISFNMTTPELIPFLCTCSRCAPTLPFDVISISNVTRIYNFVGHLALP